MSRRTRPSDSPNQGRHDSKLRLNWLRFGRRDKSKSKKQKRSRSRTDTGSRFTSNHGQSDANASQILANAALFPMQYHGDTYSMESFPDELIFIPFRDTDPSTQQPHHSPTHIFSADSKSRSQFKSDFKSRHKSSKLSHVHGVSALLIHGNPKNYPLSHFMILFHGNGVDLGMASTIWRPLIRSLPIHLLVVEYPGYGIMDGTCSCKEVLSVAEHVYRYVTTSRNDGGLGIPSERLIILGRSIGTGPASHIATNKCHSLILVSPFTSIHDLSSKLMGKWSTWMLPSDYGHCRRQRSESLDDLPGLLYDDNAEYNLNAQELSMSIQSIDSPIYDETVDSKAIDDDEDNHKNPMRTQSQRYLQNERNEKSLSPLSSMSTLKRSQTVSVTSKHLNLKKRAKEKQFVFNNVTQIAEWQCRNLMIFHGKSDELIPYQHTDTIIDMVQQTRPDIKTKKFLIDGVGHNDVNIQFIGLRIFMQYQRDLQAETSDPDDDSIEEHIDIDDMVSYLDNPPQFDMVMRRVQNFGPELVTQSLSDDKVKKGSGSTFGSLTEEDTETTTVSVEMRKRLNEWDDETRTFIEYRSELPSKTYHLSMFMRKQEEERRRQQCLENDQIQTHEESELLFLADEPIM